MTNIVENFPEILTACRFYLELTLNGSTDPVDAYFLECRGFKRSQEVIEICEVVPKRWGNDAIRGLPVRTKMPGNVKSTNITLRRGLTCSMSLWQWFETVQDGNWAKQRRNGALTIYNQKREMQALFEFYGAWPTSYTIADVSVTSGELEIEEVEIAFEEFKRVQ